MSLDFPPVVVEQTLSCSPEELWSAITNPDQMRRWFFKEIPDFQPVVGFETRFNIHSEGRDFLHLWNIVEVDAPNRIAYSWRYEGYPGDSTALWEIQKTADGSTLKLTHTVHEMFPQDIPEFRRESCQGGWDYFVSERLPAYLAEST